MQNDPACLFRGEEKIGCSTSVHSQHGGNDVHFIHVKPEAVVLFFQSAGSSSLNFMRLLSI